MAVLVAVGGLLAPPAGAKVLLDRATGQKFGIVPAPTAPPQKPMTRSGQAQRAFRLGASATPTCDPSIDPQCASPLTYQGGPVQHGENDILFFWGPQSFLASSYVTDMQTWLNSVAASDFSTGNTVGSPVGNPLSVAQQYYDNSGPGGTRSFVPLAVRNGGTVLDADPYPTSGCTDSYSDPYNGNAQVTFSTCLSAPQLFSELNSYIHVHNLPHGLNTEYFILTAPGVGSCDDSSSQACAVSDYCGWHSAAGSASVPSSVTIFADLPYIAGTPCDLDYALSSVQGSPYPQLYPSGIDSVVGVFSHELAESMTDPLPSTGWVGSGGGSDEIGDKCAYQYATGAAAGDLTGLPQTGAGSFFNATLAGNDYLLQTEYSNQTGGCSQWDTDTQPTATISAPATPTGGVPASFALTNVVDPAGIAYVTWYFGDGAAGASSGTAAIRHTYSAAGSRTVTAIVTDNHGNETKLTRALTVASGGTNSVSAHPPSTVKVKTRYSIRLSGHAVGTKTLYMFLDYRACANTPAGEHARATGEIWTVSGSFSEASWGKAPTVGVDHVCAYLVNPGHPKNPSTGIVAHDFVSYRVHR